MNIEELRKNGFRVRVTHYRPYNLVRVTQSTVHEEGLVPAEEIDYLPAMAKHELPAELHKYVKTHGGYTVVELTSPDGVEVSEVSDCSATEPFNRRRGVTIALGRALTALKQAKEAK